MCGITGLYLPDRDAAQAFALNRAMTHALIHRGPDDGGHWQCPASNLVLGHRRLSIQDLSPLGAQPMLSRDGRYALVFNGEIYNFQAISRELASAGHSFRGHSDTEVLLTAIQAWGLDDALRRSIGMFALGLWDSHTRELHLVRDRIGEKPLYYGMVNGGLAFASELKAFFALTPPASLKLDMDALGSYLRYGYVSAPHSIFADIRKLRPGHRLTIKLADGYLPDLDTLTADQRPYWSLDGLWQSAPVDINDAEALTELEKLLAGIVREQAVADVPLGAFLSGGIDSSLVAAVFQANSSRPIKTFTIGFEDAAFNEAEHAKAIAAHLGSDHTEYYVSPRDALDALPAMAGIYDEPFADSSQIPTYLVCRLARSQVTVCLAGDGGDELFGGYNRYLWTRRTLDRTRRLPKPLRSLAAGILRGPAPRHWDRLAGWLYGMAGRKGPAAVGLKLHKLAALMECNHLHDAYRLLSSYWDDPGRLLLADIREPLLSPPAISEQDFLRDAMFWDQQWYLPGDNLVKTDRASMAVSLEMRLPLLDQRLIEFAARLPDHLKIRGNETKWLLRQLLYRHVPRQLIERPKMGFSVPVAAWLRGDLNTWAGDLLSPDYLRNQGLFDPALVSQVWQQHLNGSHDHSHKLWTLLMFQQWQATLAAGGRSFA